MISPRLFNATPFNSPALNEEKPWTVFTCTGPATTENDINSIINVFNSALHNDAGKFQPVKIKPAVRAS